FFVCHKNSSQFSVVSSQLRAETQNFDPERIVGCKASDTQSRDLCFCPDYFFFLVAFFAAAFFFPAFFLAGAAAAFSSAPSSASAGRAFFALGSRLGNSGALNV